MRSEKLLKSMTLTILTVITLSIIIPATTTLALSTGKHPIATAAILSTSRDAFGRKVWKNQYFYVDIYLTSKPADEITLTVEVGGVPYSVNASYQAGTAYLYRAWFYIDENGKLYGNESKSELYPTLRVSELTTLEEGDSITIEYSGASVTLTFEHTEASVTIRSNVPYPLNLTGTNDWTIVAPDLNKDPESIDNFTAYVEIMDYTQGWTSPKKVLVPFEETDENSGEFEPTTISITNTSKKPASGDVPDLKVNYEGYKEFAALLYNNTKLNVTYALTLNITDITNTTKDTTGYIAGHLKVNGTINFKAGDTVITTYPVSGITEFNVTNGTIELVTVELYDTDTGYNIGKVDAYVNLTETTTYKFTVENITITPYTEYAYRLAKVEGEAPGDYVEIAIKVPQYIGASKDPDTASKTPTIFTAIGSIEVPVATLNTLNITVTDADENRHSYAIDSVTIYIKFPNGTIKSYTLDETDEDTGVFSETFAPYEWVKTGLLNYTHNSLEINETTYYYSSATGELKIANVSKSVDVAYTTAEVSVSPTEIMIPVTREPVVTLVVTVNDGDLNLLTDSVDAWTVTLDSGENLSSKVLEHTGGLLSGLAKLTIEAVKDSTSVYLNASAKTAITFVETGEDTGVFKAYINLRNFDWDWVRSALGGIPDKLVITYTDVYTSDLEPEDVEAEVTVVKANITVDRDVIPVTRHGDVKIGITVTDPSAAGRGTISIKVTAYDYEGNNVTTISKASVDATETGIETGVFKCTFTIPKEAITPKLIGGRLVISYGDLEKEIPFEIYGVEMYVNGSSSITVKYGDVINVTIVDPDRNLDNSEVDKFSVEVNDKLKLNFTETGPDTGIFVTTYTVDSDFGEAGKPVDIEYEDLTPTYATPGMDIWPNAETYSVTVYIQSFTGKLLVNGEEEYLEVGPIGKLNITVVDWDMNKDPDDINNVTIYIKLWNGTYKSFTAYETEDSTGVFTLSVDIKDEIGTPGEIIGKNIQVVYRDEVDAAGEVTTKIVTLKFISWDPEITTDKTAYNIGEKIKITLKDLDANTDPDKKDSAIVRVYSTSDPIGASIPLRETGKDTGVFIGEVLVSDTMMSGAVYAKLGDIITIEYTDKYPADYGVTGEEKIFTYTVRV
ncbi:MAG: hypothetical protein DRH17_13700, partial [Deltaproteobacteria bacterium]